MGEYGIYIENKRGSYLIIGTRKYIDAVQKSRLAACVTEMTALNYAKRLIMFFYQMVTLSLHLNKITLIV